MRNGLSFGVLAHVDAVKEPENDDPLIVELIKLRGCLALNLSKKQMERERQAS